MGFSKSGPASPRFHIFNLLLLLISLFPSPGQNAQAAWQFEAWKNTSLTLSCVEGPKSGSTEPLIAAGERGTLLVSRNNQWSSLESGTEAWLRSAHSQSNVWVVVGDHGTILRSTNASRFDPVEFLPNASWVAVLAVQGRWILLSDSGFVATTRDFKNWTTRTIPTTSSVQFRSIAFGDGLYVAGGSGGNLYRSTDLDSWDPAPIPSRVLVTEIAYGAQSWIAVAETNLWRSSDTLEWSRISLPRSELLRSAKWVGTSPTATTDGIWVAVGNNGTIFASVLQGPWVEAIPGPRTSEVRHDLHQVRFFSGEWTVVGARGTIWKAYSSSGQRARPELGTSWIPFQDKKDLEFTASAARDQTVTLLGTGLEEGENGAAMVSNAGTLSQANMGILTLNQSQLRIAAAAADSRIWLAVGDRGQAFISTTANSWATLDPAVDTGTRPELKGAVTGLNTTYNLHAIASSGREWIMVGEQGMIRKSDTNGLIWSAVRSPTLLGLHGIAYSQNQWMIVGENQLILRSSNTLDWEIVHSAGPLPPPQDVGPSLKALPLSWELCNTPAPPAPISIKPRSHSRILRVIARSSSWWVATGDEGAIWISADGSSWNQSAQLGSEPLLSMVFRGNRGLCGGTDGRLFETWDGGATWTSLRRQSRTAWSTVTAQRRGNTWWWLAAGGNAELLARPIDEAPATFPYLLSLQQIRSTPTPTLELSWPANTPNITLLESTFPHQLFQPSTRTVQRRGGISFVTINPTPDARAFFRIDSP